jgi:hypothetical protein
MPRTHFLHRRWALRGSLLLLVMALHASVGMALRSSVVGLQARQPSGGASEPIAMLWLRPMVLPLPQAQPREAQPASSSDATGVPTKAKTRRAEASTLGPTAAVGRTPSEAADSASNVDVAREPDPPSGAPLNLSLPRERAQAPQQRHPALDDARSNSPRPTLASAIAAAALGGSWTEERLGPDTVRFRRGNLCIDAHRPRVATLNAISDAARATPWALGPPKPC